MCFTKGHFLLLMPLTRWPSGLRDEGPQPIQRRITRRCDATTKYQVQGEMGRIKKRGGGGGRWGLTPWFGMFYGSSLYVCCRFIFNIYIEKSRVFISLTCDVNCIVFAAAFRSVGATKTTGSSHILLLMLHYVFTHAEMKICSSAVTVNFSGSCDKMKGARESHCGAISMLVKAWKVGFLFARKQTNVYNKNILCRMVQWISSFRVNVDF